jgi:L-amino acid N-acyltransferase YncA
MNLTLRSATQDDGPAIATIYNHYIATTTISFEEAAVSADEMGQRVADLLAQDLPWLVAVRDGQILGYAYASPWRVRHAYRFSVESSVYLAPEHTGQGLGSRLYRELIAGLRNTHCHLVIGGVALPNDASIALHEKLGFEKVAHFKEVGFKFGHWIDVGYWQLTLAESDPVQCKAVTA